MRKSRGVTIRRGSRVKLSKKEMDFLATEIAEKKSALASASSKSSISSRKRRYVKVGDLRKAREEKEAGGKSRGGEDEGRGGGRDGSSRKGKEASFPPVDRDKGEHGAGSASKSPSKYASDQLRRMKATGTTVEFVQKKLREFYSVPVRLFGEDNEEIFLRLIALETRDIEKGDEDFALGYDQNSRNVFLGGSTAADQAFSEYYTPGGPEIGMREEDEDEDNEGDESGNGGEAASKKADIGEKSGNGDEAGVSKPSTEKELDPHKEILTFFKSLLKQWSSDLSSRPSSVSKTQAGKNALKTHKQCKDYIRPLFSLLKSKSLALDQLESMRCIVRLCKEGEFVQANDKYIDIAIGRAAWPIGVTMVGIHARAGREKINGNKTAHVMNSEMQRKYLTSVKRLMTYAQGKRDDVGPSRKVG